MAISNAKAIFSLACVIIAVVVIALTTNNLYQAHLKVVESEEELKQARIEAKQALDELDTSIQELNEFN